MATETENTENVETIDIDATAIEPEDGADLEKKSAHYCYHQGRIIMNGRGQRDPDSCSIFRCNNGRVRQEQDQCKHKGRCHQVGRSWNEDCTTYRCDRRRDRKNRIRFVASPVSAKCVDAHGNCRRPGEKFPHVQNGRYRSRCTCRQYKYGNEMRTRYKC
ncbi:hypothetical protein LOTGIDRAFT_157586 [Lottia gigantea]|uniref:Uncharacterized protein n=1 Tax=Lottia gigantea TaxID=225164 RepID=V4CH39_LOTGI|nr:hypothetical protein LOTGIDRAFT_157586 [Lottia gigantea]ESP01405.1 hypothetical protein LOTGIDRAFT_157586 [Lottia gigantea]